MSGYTRLIGAEEVARAGHNMQGAAESIARSAMYIEQCTERLIVALAEHADRIEQATKIRSEHDG